MILKLAVLCAAVAATIAHDAIEGLHAPQPYTFGYTVKDGHGEQFRKESGLGGHVVKGSYGFHDDTGIYRRVDYVADHGGFRAQVMTNEPGTANQDPASVKVISSAHPGAHGGYMHGTRNDQESSGGSYFGNNDIYNGYDGGAYWMTGDGVHGSEFGHALGFGNKDPKASFGDPSQKGLGLGNSGYGRYDPGLEYPLHRANVGGIYGTSFSDERQSNPHEPFPFNYGRYAKLYEYGTMF